MAVNKGKIDQIHDLLPSHLHSRTNTNWKALVDALGEQDQNTADLVTEVRKQFFVKTASRPYLDRLAANSKISRPKLVGMDDPSFRQYIPILSYQPKQVKLIIDQLLDIFFFKESTTAFITSTNFQPFALQDGWELRVYVDEQYTDSVVFKTNDFTNIAAATADEIVGAINRQTKYCYATADYDSITKQTFIRMFTNTIGSTGSLRILGGRANTALRFNGFITTAGNGADTEWTVSKIGDDVTFTHTAGTNPNVEQLQVGDIVIINLTNNQGSFAITNVDLVNNAFTFKNLFATVGVYTNSSADDVKFIRPQKFVAYLNPRRAMTWETSPGEITVEMPTSPPVVKRSLQGSAHINGASSLMTNRNSNTSLTVADAFQFPESGTFWLERLDEIQERILTMSENFVSYRQASTRLQNPMDRFEYASRQSLSTTGDFVTGVSQITNLASVTGLSPGQQVIHPAFSPFTRIISIAGLIVNTSFPPVSDGTGETIKFLGNTLTGITPNLPAASSLNEFALTSLTRSSNVVTGTTSSAHGYVVGENVILSGVTGIDVGENLNTGFTITAVTSNTFTFTKIGLNGSASVPGTARVERIGLANAGSEIIVTDAISNQVSRITGSYIWDLSAEFVLSSNTAAISDSIQAGKIVRLLNVGSNTISKDGGFLIFNYGTEAQEGPVRYLYKPTDTTIALDPSYTFKFGHSIGSPIVSISHKGPHEMSGRATEYPAYITNPSDARFILEDLIRSVKSAGIFVNFLVHYPEQLYGVLDVYNQQGLGAGEFFR